MINKILENPQNVISYIKHKSERISSTKMQRDNFILYLILAIPTGFFGVDTKFTIPLIMSFIVGLGLFMLLLNRPKGQNAKNTVLYNGIYSIIFSLTCMLAAYKFLSTIKVVTLIEVLTVLLIYVICIVAYNMHIIRLIMKGRYLSPKAMNPFYYSIILVFSMTGIGVGKLIGSIVSSNEIVVLILSLCLVFIGFVMSLGTHNFMKYYFIIKLNYLDSN